MPDEHEHVCDAPRQTGEPLQLGERHHRHVGPGQRPDRGAAEHLGDAQTRGLPAQQQRDRLAGAARPHGRGGELLAGRGGRDVERRRAGLAETDGARGKRFPRQRVREPVEHGQRGVGAGQRDCQAPPACLLTCLPPAMGGAPQVAARFERGRLLQQRRGLRDARQAFDAPQHRFVEAAWAACAQLQRGWADHLVHAAGRRSR